MNIDLGLVVNRSCNIAYTSDIDETPPAIAIVTPTGDPCDPSVRKPDRLHFTRAEIMVAVLLVVRDLIVGLAKKTH